MILSDLTQLNQDLPKFARLACLDIGTKRIGIALSDATRLIASPKQVLIRQGNKKDFEKIKNFLGENQVFALVLGLPINMDDSEIEMTFFVKKFAEELDDFFEKKLPIYFFEERLTSFEARGFNASPISRKKNKFVDDIAASVILQHFLDELAQSQN